MNLEEEVLKRVMPGSEEEARLQAISYELIDKLNRKIADSKWDATPVLVGSVAKGTHLRGAELDIFVTFDPSLPRSELERRGLELGKVLSRRSKRYAEHPYTHGYYKRQETEIVPCYRITKAAQKLSAVDRTPLHARFVAEKLTTEQRDQVRLLKAFAEGIGVYGAEAKVQGFSGYLCELLVLKFGSFRAVLENAKNWKTGEVLELEGKSTRQFSDPLVFIDPVDPNRNVASALSVEKFAIFVYAAGEYLRSPRIEFFFPRRRKSISASAAARLLAKRGTVLLILALDRPKLTDDVLYPQMRKGLRSLVDLLDRYGFSILRGSFATTEDEVLYLLEFETYTLPRVEKHYGPPVSVRNSKDFLKKWTEHGKSLSGPYIEGYRWVVEVERQYTDASQLLREGLRRATLGKHLDRQVRKGLRILIGRVALKTRYAEAITAFLQPRFPWETL